MTHRFRCWLSVSCVVLATAIGGCTTSAAPVMPERVRQPRLTSTARYLDATQIQQSGATTAWDAIRVLAPHHRLAEIGPLGTPRTPVTGGSGLASSSGARVLLDGVTVPDPSVLRTIPAFQVIDIQVLGAMEAMMLFGSEYGAGAIVVRTTAGLRTR
jgi:hypothetical protein